MRIISGIYKGRRLISGNDLSIRPTTDRVKEYIFNILLDFPREKRVIDVFAGSGNLGLEALSRGAAHATFVEKAASSVLVLKKNLQNIHLSDKQYRIIQSDALDWAQSSAQSYDLFLLDPPFDYPPLQNLLNIIFSRKLLNEQGLLVVEHEISNPIVRESDVYVLLKQKKMGRSLISLLEQR